MNAAEAGGSSPLDRPVASTTDAARSAHVRQMPATADATHTPAGGVSLRLGRRQLLQLAHELVERDRQLLLTVQRFRLVQSDQLQRLFFNESLSRASAARVSRRSLRRLDELGVLRRLDRRIGGVRAGSSGHVYAVGPAGRRLLAHLEGRGGSVSDRGVHEPGLPFVAHTLAITELYVRLAEAERAGLFELTGFETEPACWRPYTTPRAGSATLKSDALVSVGLGAYEHTSWVEIDLGTTGRSALLRKCRAYIAYHATGKEQADHSVFPRAVWITPNPLRARYIAELVHTLPTGVQRLFATATSDQAIATLTGTDNAGEGEETA